MVNWKSLLDQLAVQDWEIVFGFLVVYSMVSCLVVNDAVKVAMIKWRVPAAVA